MQNAVSEWLMAARRRFPWPPSRSVTDSVGTAGDEFTRNAEYLRLTLALAFHGGSAAERRA
jgi:hypothetical protein